jgi:hypothetical protein
MIGEKLIARVAGSRVARVPIDQSVGGRPNAGNSPGKTNEVISAT